MARLEELVIGGRAQPWIDAGFAVHSFVFDVAGVSHRLAPGAGKGGIASWALSGVTLPDGAHDLDGLATTVVLPADPQEAKPALHPNGVLVLDHVVVATPDHERTRSAFEGAGLGLRGTRRTESSGRPLEQAFYRLGPVIVEVIGPPDRAGDDPARFYGLAYTVADLDRSTAFLAERVHPPKDAVQPGRRIATLDRSAALGVPVAFMSQ